MRSLACNVNLQKPEESSALLFLIKLGLCAETFCYLILCSLACNVNLQKPEESSVLLFLIKLGLCAETCCYLILCSLACNVNLQKTRALVRAHASMRI